MLRLYPGRQDRIVGTTERAARANYPIGSGAQQSTLSLDGSSPDNLLQVTLFNQRKSQCPSRLKAFDEDIERYQSSQRSRGDAREAISPQGWNKLNYLDAEVGRMRTERDYQDTSNRLNELRHSLASTQAERQVFIDEWRRQLLEELVKARKEASTVAESLVKAVRMNDLVVLTAPEDGIVLEVAKRSVGSVMQGAEPLVTLVPTTAALIAEVMISSADVGYTKLGDDVAIKVDAFPYQRHGLLYGRLRAVGEPSRRLVRSPLRRAVWRAAAFSIEARWN
jgi:HlyD family secretion protein